jgi:hypothetical protein
MKVHGSICDNYICTVIDWYVCGKKQSSTTIYHSPTRENKLPVAVCSKQAFVFRLQQTNFHFPFAANKLPFSDFSKQTEVCRFHFPYIYEYICCCFKRKTEAQAIFLNLFTVCSSCKRKFVVCPSVNEETNGSYLFANGRNRLTHLCIYIVQWKPYLQ